MKKYDRMRIFTQQEAMQPLINIAVSAARQAAQVITRNMDLIDRLKVSEKENHEVFSEVDIKAEQAIINTILKAYPSHGILAEESGSYQEDAECIWIIDPLDGTNNFLHNYPAFAISIACKINNRIEHGVIYDPIRNECFTASRGRGARFDDKRIRVSNKIDLNQALLSFGLQGKDPAKIQYYIPILQKLLGQCGGFRRSGSAALDLAYVACGRLDGYWEFGLKPWDIAAGALIIKEAGGLIGDPTGQESFMQSGDIVAGTPKIFKSLLQIINPLITSTHIMD